MFDLQVLIVIIASLLAVIGNISYLRDALTGKVKPHPYTWFIWSIVSLTTFLGGLAKGAGIGAIPTGIAEGFTVLIFLLSLKYLFQGGAKHIRVIDNYFLAAALLGLIPWALTKDPTLSVIIAVSIDLVAFIPTLRKASRYPETETPILYGTNVFRHVLTMLSLSSYNIATTLHSIAMLVANGAMSIILLRARLCRSKTAPDEKA